MRKRPAPAGRFHLPPPHARAGPPYPLAQRLRAPGRHSRSAARGRVSPGRSTRALAL